MDDDLYRAAMIAEGAIPAESEEEYLGAWQTLVDTGLAWRLQGFFGRTARDLIEAGLIQRPGEKAQGPIHNEPAARQGVQQSEPDQAPNGEPEIELE
jgi:hypothetical protein